ncbi:MAG: glycosyltransferase [Verrucomicrobiae bacterium]|nr:glycosyltransferase [Verrucomicrobiae bacterium]
MPRLRLANLERPKFSLKSLNIKFASRCNARSSRLANVLFEETVKSASTGGKGLREPIFVNYPQLIAPPTRHPEFCVFIHDLNWRLYPGNFQDPELTDRNCRGWVDCASKVIANSECTRDEIIERYHCTPEKVLAAPLAPFQQRLPQAFDAPHYLAGLGLSAGRFDLFPGVWGLHKGHAILTEAIELSEEAHPVVVTCGLPLHGINGSTKAVAALRHSLAARWDKLIEEKKLVVVGGVPELEMQALRGGCRAYVLPAQYEGYGFPLAEAVYHHRPAIVSDIKAHREILDRYPQYQLATLFPADSSNALAEKLKRVDSEPLAVPRDWQRSIEATWSWKNTLQVILTALNADAVLPQ